MLTVPGLFAQDSLRIVTGKIQEKDEDGHLSTLVGASVYWSGTTLGTTTSSNGEFSIERTKTTNLLIVSFVGYGNDTITVGKSNHIDVLLDRSIDLGIVEVVHRTRSTEISMMDPIKIENIGKKELLKAACCNLAESFETNPSVDVSFTDAVTGTKQIQMLGLSGPYTQITRENMPYVRGISSIYGLTYIPGPWISSIQLNKGMGSVANGYESIAGQINVELRKPEVDDRLYLTTYTNEKGRVEGNLVYNQAVTKKIGTGLLLHGSANPLRHDNNNDGFLDHTVNQNLIGLNRWKYAGDDGFRMQLGIETVISDHIAGQNDFDSSIDSDTSQIWGMRLDLRRYQGWAKFGKVYEDRPWKSIGLQISGSTDSQQSNFGTTQYNAEESTLYLNLIYQSIFSTTDHKIKIGASAFGDDYYEKLRDTSFVRKEYVTGTFAEYTYLSGDKFTAVIGLRADYHNMFGLFATPRVHLRYKIGKKNIVRASVGRGLRAANIISENKGILASSREIVIMSEGENLPYGLNPEIAQNYGLNFTRNFTIDYRDGIFSVDLYKTDFENQVVLDLEDPRKAVFYNLDGKSYSYSLQTQLDYELIKRLDMRVAYRFNEVKTTFNGDLILKPFIASHRAFINLGYETRKYWKFDYTLNWIGQKRIPSTKQNPEEYQVAGWSPDFFLMNAQVSKTWKEMFEVYVGAENLLNFRQSNPIIANEEPFDQYFDASLVWGPIFGRTVYFGIRYTVK
ncbi:MAG: TonB-dependent receptor [Flavobacteriales bacterium]|nr:TonB-dependent receptor [Flavobacteriales bacterium]